MKDAYAETDPKLLPQKWLAVDAAFVFQGGNLRAVHPIEDGYAKNDTGAIPEQSLRYFMPEHPANARIQELKQFIVERFPEILSGNEGAMASLPVVERVDARMAYYAVRSGMEIVFKIAGHNIPNEESVRRDCGVNAFIDPDTMAGRIEEGKALFRQFFGAEASALLTQVNMDNVFAEIAVHELGHNIGNRGVFQENPKGVGAVEEWKATATTYVTQSLRGEEQLTDEYLRGTFLSFLCQTFRYAQRREEGSQRPYFGADKIFTNTALGCGCFVMAPDGQWLLHLTRENLLQYMDDITEKWLELQRIYSSADQEAMNEFIKDNVYTGPFLGDVMAFVDKQ